MNGWPMLQVGSHRAVCRIMADRGRPEWDLLKHLGKVPVQPTIRSVSVGRSVRVEAEPVRLTSVRVPPTPEPSEELTREHPDRYALDPEQTQELGRGGIGRVYLALDRHLGREVAIKELLLAEEEASAYAEPGAARPTVRERFLSEARVTGQLEHPNIVPVYELGERSDGTLYYAMRAVRGRTLSEAIGEATSLAERLRLVSHFAGLCQAIAYAHSRGVIHRDIKPDNVMIGEFGETVVLDWGLAKIRGCRDFRREAGIATRRVLGSATTHQTAYGDVCGTPSYMSPEQALGHLDDVDECSDVWSLGAVLYTIVSGHPPFAGPTVLSVLNDVIGGKYEPLGTVDTTIPIELVAIVQRALARDKQQRYPSALELAHDVEAFQSGARVAAHEYSSWELMRRFVARQRAAVLVGMLGLLAAGSLGAASYRRIVNARDRAVAAEQRASRHAQQARHSLAEAFAEKALASQSEGDAVAAELYGAAALRLEERPDARGIVVATSNLPRPTPRRDVVGLRQCDAAVYAPEANIVVCVRGRRLERWQGGVTAEGQAYELPPGKLTSLAVSPDATKTALGFGGGNITLLISGQGASGEERRSVRLSSSCTSVTALAFDAHGGRLASGDDAGNVVVEDWVNGSTLDRFSLGQAVSRVAFSSDGTRVAAGGRLGRLLLSDLTGRGAIKELFGHSGTISTVAFSPRGDFLVTGSADRTMRLYHASSGEPLADPLVMASAVTAAQWSPDSQSILFGSRDGSVWLLDARLRKDPLRLSAHADKVRLVGFSSRSRTALSMSRGLGLRWWSLDRGAPSRLVARGNVLAVALTTDGRTAVTAGLQDDGVCLWDLKTGECGTRLPADPQGVRALALAPDGRSLAAAGTRGSVILWDLERRLPRRVLEGHTGEIRGLAYAPSGAWLASVGLDGALILWSNSADAPLARFDSKSALQAVSVSRDGRHVATAGRDGALRVYSAQAWRLRSAARTPQGWATAVVFSADGQLVYSGNEAGQLLETSLDGAIRRSKEAHQGRVTSLALSADGLWLASAGEDHRVCVFSLPSLALRATLVGHEGIVRALAWGRGRLASGADDATVRFWQTSELKRPPQALLEATERKFAVTLRGTKLVPRVHFISMGLKSNTDWP